MRSVCFILCCLWTTAVFGCEREPADETSSAAPAQAQADEPRPAQPATPEPSPAAAYDTPERDEAELTTVLSEACALAEKRAAPMLLEFSAAWCKDCRELKRLEQAPALAAELARWVHVPINVGRFNRHKPLLAQHRVKAIAQWSVVAPECDAAPHEWTVRARRTLEPLTGEERGITPEALAAWLAGQRG